MTMVMIIMLITVLAYFSWIVIYIRGRIDKSPKLSDYIGNNIYAASIYICNVNNRVIQQWIQVINIFIVLISAIQFGRNYSLGVASISTIIILLIDFISVGLDKQTLSQYFEKDLVLLSALFVTAFILGMYVDIEREHSKELKNLANIDELTGCIIIDIFKSFYKNLLTMQIRKIKKFHYYLFRR